MTSISIIIPTLNEEKHLEKTLANLSLQLTPQDEIIVADGGSKDLTKSIAKQYDAKVILSKKGRGVQMNTGASHARGTWFLFLHADTQLHPESLSAIRTISKDHGYGCFPIKFDKPNLRLKWVEWYSWFRIHVLKTMYGDQAIFVRKSLFRKVGGYPDYPLFEDVALSKTLKKHSKARILKCPVTTSARYFMARGFWRTSYIINKLRILYFFGTPPDKLYEIYYSWKQK